jgi:hypothetical protein
MSAAAALRGAAGATVSPPATGVRIRPATLADAERLVTVVNGSYRGVRCAQHAGCLHARRDNHARIRTARCPAASAAQRHTDALTCRLMGLCRARQNGNWTHEQGIVAGPRVTHEDVTALLAAQCAHRAPGEQPPSLVLVAELPEECEQLIGAPLPRTPTHDAHRARPKPQNP